MTPEMQTEGRSRMKISASALLAVFGLAMLPPLLEARRFETPPWRASLALGGGIFYPSQSPVRTLYGNVSFPLHFQLDVRLGGAFSVVAAYRFLGASGSTVIVGPSVEEESYGLRLNIHSVRAGFRLDSALGRSRIFAQFGAAYNVYQESWKDAGISVDGRLAGIFLAAGTEIPVGRAWAVQLRLEYASVPTDKGGLLDPDIDLGGADAVLGVVYRFGRRR